MKIKTILMTLAVAAVALFAASCSETDTGANAGGYYIKPLEDAEGANAEAQLQWNKALNEAFPGITYKTAENDSKAIAACDKVYEKVKAGISIKFQLYFQTAVAEGKQPEITNIKTYSPEK